jgi:Na+/H+-dicarboxylate symporter
MLYAVLVATLGRRAPLRLFGDLRALLLLAFSSSSSAAVMLLSIRTAESVLGVRASVARLLVPLGATVNMNGTALYQGVATVFHATAFGVPAAGIALILGVDRLLDTTCTAVNVPGDMTACVVIDRLSGARAPVPRAAAGETE